MSMKIVLAGLVIAAIADAAQAKDEGPCSVDLVCASKPATVVAALQAAGFTAKLDKDNQGDPSVSSAAAGYNFDVLFYGCDGHIQCDSLQFRLTFKADDMHTPDLANKWNVGRRFLKAEVRDDKRFIFNYDVSTIGGLNQTNFADVLDWWKTMVGEADKFFANTDARK